MSLPEDPIVYWDSEFIPLSKALVPVSDRGYSHGDGVFCALTITDGVVELWEEHFLKFSEDAQYLNLTLPNLDYLGILKQVIEANGVTVGKWKTLIMASGRDVSGPGLPPASPAHMHFRVICPSNHHRLTDDYPGHKVNVYPSPCMIPFTQHKTMAHLMRHIIAQHARDAGFEDSVVLTENGVILETAFSNIFWISGDSIYHPHPSLPFYDGSGFQSFLKFVSSAANTALPQFQAHPGFYTIKDIPEDAKIFRISSYVFDPIVELGDRTFTRDLNLEATIKEEYFKWKVETGVNLLSYNSTI